jgi:alkylated DNA repair dioxygenase AlkB
MKVDIGQGAWFELKPGWWREGDYCTEIRRSTEWASRSLVMAGKEVKQPRRIAWMADDLGAVYRYSGTDNKPSEWTPTVLGVREALKAREGLAFNSCFLNLYRDGQDSIGWHSDDEPLFGENPTIASVSFGASRTFQIRHVVNRRAKNIRLADGDLLVMGGTFQTFYEHQIPKEPRVTYPRVNLTFRNVTQRKELNHAL